MTDRLQTQRQPGRTQVNELTSDELEHVSGGAEAFRGGVYVAVGDVNGDGAVDSRDYVVWRKSAG